MNPTTIASTFSVQKISKHHYLIRGDPHMKEFMEFCDFRWSKTYDGWIVNEDDEVDLLQLHIEVLDGVKEQREKITKKNRKDKKSKKDKKKKLVESSDSEFSGSESEESSESEEVVVKKKKTTNKKLKKEVNVKKEKKKMSDYEKLKNDVDISDSSESETDDEDYIPQSDPSSEEFTSESESEEEESDCSKSEEKTIYKKEYWYYKKGILATGKMTKKEQIKLDAVWNKHLNGYILRKSCVEQLEKLGWKEFVEVPEPKINILVPKKKVKTIDGSTKSNEVQMVEKYYSFFKKFIFVYGTLSKELKEELEAIAYEIYDENSQSPKRPEGDGYLVDISLEGRLKELGYLEKKKPNKELVKLEFKETKKLEIKDV